MASLHRRTIFATSNEHYTEEQRKSWAIGLSAETYKKSAANGEIYLVAVNEDDQPLAFCGYKGNEICGLYVDPSHQNRGIGQRLLFRAFVNMHQSQPEKIILSASSPAKAFYEKHGYKTVTKRNLKTRGGAQMQVYDMESAPITYSDQIGAPRRARTDAYAGRQEAARMVQ